MSDEPISGTQVSAPQPAAAAPRSQGPSVRQMVVVVAILAIGVLVTAMTSDVTRVSEPGIRLVNGEPVLPDQAGGWTGGKPEGLTEVERNVLPADTKGVRRAYRDAAGNELFCSIVLSGREVSSIHRPELCLPGQGWKIESEYTEPVSTPEAPGGVLQVMRMNATRTSTAADNQGVVTRFVFAYWFVGKDRVTPYHWQRILWTAEDRVLHNRNHRWAYIMVYTPNGPRHDSDEESMQLIAQFVQGVYPQLAADTAG